MHSGNLFKNIKDRVATSAGLACHFKTNRSMSLPTALLAMKVPREYAEGTLRISMGPSMTPSQIDKASQIIADEVKRQLASKNLNQVIIKDETNLCCSGMSLFLFSE